MERHQGPHRSHGRIDEAWATPISKRTVAKEGGRTS